MKGCKWTSEEHGKLIKEINEGLTTQEIAKNHNRTEYAITCRIIKYLIEPRINKEESINDVCEFYKLPKEVVEEFLQKDKNRILLKDATNMLKTGKSVREVQDEIGISNRSLEYIKLIQKKKNDLKKIKLAISLMKICNKTIEEASKIVDVPVLDIKKIIEI